MPRRPVHPGAPDGLVARIMEMLRDTRTWTTIIYLVMMLPLGIVYFVTVVTGLSLAVSFILVPVVGVAQRARMVGAVGKRRADHFQSRLARHARRLGRSPSSWASSS